MTKRFRDTPRFTPKWWLTLPFTAKDIVRRLTPKDRAIEDMQYWSEGALDRRPVEALFASAASASFTLVNAGRRTPGTSLTLFELGCLLLALRECRAKRVVEIGTFDGNTALNLAVNLPEDGEVVTIDLPLEHAEEYALPIDGVELRNVSDRRVVGGQFRDHPARARIRQVFGDSARVDFDALGGPFDLAFIDGCHDYAYVKNDTEKVLRVVRPGGLVVWHDYALMPSVSRAVDEYRDRLDQLTAIEGTRLAIGWVRGGARVRDERPAPAPQEIHVRSTGIPNDAPQRRPVDGAADRLATQPSTTL